MLKGVLAFVAVIGSVLGAQERYTYNGELWKKEIDLVDYGKMDLTKTWGDWMQYFGKKYSSIEEEYKRFGVFLENLQKIALWNTDSSNGASLRPNQFTDLTTEEFVQYVHGKNGRCFSGSNRPKFTIGAGHGKPKPQKPIPDSVDWEAAGKVTPRKNWLLFYLKKKKRIILSLFFNSYAIANNVLNSLSEQQLVDCSVSEGNLGCDGGEMDNAFKYVIKTGGLCSETEYPYTAADGKCQATTCGTYYNPIVNYTDVKVKDESALEEAAAVGCVSVAIQANQFAFQYYSSGVLTGDCGTNLDHGVLVVGYGTDSGQEYWKVKNSWGTDWGENGYVLICRDCDKNGDQGECGINDDPSYPGPKVQ
ncbi:cysteine protease [Reticulomyxa filosa]|uniref:Cysteine protease n=1 Tax=Reticulomyxa filosa TaxID=46433 RepID=X6MEB5_RETFI|nr:cysteine protease [Reticulomyxa filosa]|eukprot:ETO11360.1 cysteine protease [Reticulomyxa filosa]